MTVQRRLLTALALIAEALVLVSCGAREHSADEKYYLVATSTKLQYWQNALAGLSAASSKLKVDAELVGPDNYDIQAEHEAFQKLLQRKPAPTGILISPADPKVLTSDIDAALQQGIPVITMDSDAASSHRLLFVGTDNDKAGNMGGQMTANLLKGRGNVAVLTMPEQLNLKQRLQGYQDAFSTHPQIKITKVVDVKGDPRLAFDSTKELLDSPGKPDAIVCLVSFACAEVADVVERENQTGKVVIVAMDTDPRTLTGIQKGVIAGTVGQKPYTMAYYGVMLLDQLHHHPLQPLVADRVNDSTSPLPAAVDTGVTLIDKANVAAFLNQRPASGGD